MSRPLDRRADEALAIIAERVRSGEVDVEVALVDAFDLGVVSGRYLQAEEVSAMVERWQKEWNL